MTQFVFSMSQFRPANKNLFTPTDRTPPHSVHNIDAVPIHLLRVELKTAPTSGARKSSADTRALPPNPSMAKRSHELVRIRLL